MKQRLADTVGYDPFRITQFIEEVIGTFLSRVRALLPCEISPALPDGSVQRLAFLPKECLNPVVEEISLGLVAFRRRVE